MRKAIIITTSNFTSKSLVPIKNIERTSNILEVVLGDRNFGNFDEVICLENLRAKELKRELSATLGENEPKSQLYIHFIGHGLKASNGSIHIALCDTLFDSGAPGPIQYSLSASDLGNLLNAQRARDIGITLDCCLAEEFREQLIQEMSEHQNAVSVKTERRKRLYFLSPKADDSDNSYSDQTGSVFSNRICELLITGESASSNPLIEFSGLEEFTSRTSVRPKIEYKSANARHSFIFAQNPNRGPLLEPFALKCILSEEGGVIEEGISKLREQAAFAVMPRLVTLKKYIPLIERSLTINASAQCKQALLELTRTINGQHEPTEERADCLIVYFTRSWRTALLVERSVIGRKATCKLFDLDFSNKYQYRGDDLFEKIEQCDELIFIIDDDWAVQIASEFYELSTFLIQGKIVAKKIAIICHGTEFSAVNSRELRDFSWTTLEDYTAGETSPNSDDAIGRSIFLDCILENQRRLEVQGSDGSDRWYNEFNFEGAVKVKNATVRVPNFLVYSADGEQSQKFTLVISDSGSRIDPTKLRPDHLPSATAQMANKEDLEKLQLIPGQIGPVFPRSEDNLMRIVIDGNLFFQFLLFPLTPIRVPNIHDGVDHPIEVTISSFFRAIQQFYGESQLLYSNTSRRRDFGDPILLELFSSHPIFTRFAPTPSSSLHLGNIRTAVVTYLFVLASADKSRFHVRFDDTNPEHKSNESYRDDILQDLKWLGIPTKAHYRQNSSKALEVYDLAAEILNSAGLLRTVKGGQGERELDVAAIDHSFAYWLDLKKGPQFIHRAPTKFLHQSRKKQGYPMDVDYSIEWPNRSYKYKFAGVFDDVCLNTLVIRDGRQEQSLFTARQSIILGALRKLIAKPTSDDIRSKARRLKSLAKSRVQLSNLPAKEKGMRPFPFGAPPIYLHVPRVCDTDGKVLSKRNNFEKFMIKEMRLKGQVLPETVICWALSTMGAKVLGGIGARNIRHLEEIVGKFGVTGTFELFANRVSFLDILSGQKSRDIRLENLRRSDTRIFALIGPARFKELCGNLWSQAIGQCDACLDLKSVEELFVARKTFRGSHDLFTYFERLGRHCRQPNIKLVEASVQRYLDTKSPSKQDHEKIRLLLTGSQEGPSARVLAVASLPTLSINR